MTSSNAPDLGRIEHMSGAPSRMGETPSHVCISGFENDEFTKNFTDFHVAVFCNPMPMN